MRHVIWDWNGTLVDDLPVVVAAVNTSLAELGSPPIDADEYRNHYTRPVRVFYDRLLGRAVTDAEWTQIDATFHGAYEAGLHHVELTEGARHAVAAIRDAGATQSILSMWWHDRLVPEVTRRGLDRYMMRVDGNVGRGGDTKEGTLRRHLDALGDVGTPVMVGDSLDDAEAAAATGLRCVLYDGGSHHRVELERPGFPIAAGLVEAVSIALDDS
jgi:phosphoglycolate phosphatase-like HAD superfamily hydrolase